MKKLHSIMMLLALMVAAFSFTACSDDDDNDNGLEGDTSSSSFTVTYNETKEVYDGYNLLTLGPSCNIEDDEIDFFFYRRNGMYFHWVFPFQTYGDIDASYFHVGFNDFIDMYLYDIGNASIDNAKHSCDYVSGKASVIANDGKNITVKFEKLTFSVERYYGIVNIVFDCTLKFEINDLR